VFSLSPSLSRSLSLSVTDQELNNGDGARLLARFSTPSLTFFFLSLLLLFLSSTAPARQRPPRPLRPSRRAQKVKRGKTENENAVSQLSVSLLIFTLSFPLFFFSLFLSRLSTTTRTHAAPALSPAAIAALYQNCLKLASENKITAKNTWALPLIDHLSDLVAPDAQAAEDEDAGGGGGGAPGTDFQRASLTLAAGVSIYAHRVDAVHGDVFKILGGLGRGGLDDDGEGDGENDGDGGENGGGAGRGGPGNGRRNAHRRRNQNGEDADPSSTLDCLENINAKKFDLAFAVDPLFQRTAALFDEGGAAGLLLNSLPLLGGPALAFDSAAVPCAVDAGAAKAGTVGGGGARLPLGCLRQEAANALRALADPAAARPCPAQLALAEAAGRAVLPPGDDGGARGLVAGVVAEIAEVEAAEREAAAAERRGSGAETEEAEGEGAADENDEEEGGEEEGQAAGGWPELERAMAVAERAAAAAAAAAPPIAVVAAIAQAPSAVAAAPAALNATDAAVAAAPLSASSPAASIQQQQQASDGDDDLGDGFGGDGGFDDDGDVEEEEEEAAGAARAAAAHAADSSPVLGGGAPARLLRHQDGDEQPSPMAMTPGTPASPAECGGASSDQALRLMLAASPARGSGDGAGSLPPSSSHQTPPGSGGGIARAVSHADEEPPPTHAKAWAGAAHWRHRAARAARANVMGQENTEHDDGAGNGSNTFVGGMFGAPTPVRGGNPLAASSLPSSSSRPGAIDFSCLPPLDPRALARAPPRLTTLRAVRARAETLLPDDVHYSPQALSRLFDAPETTPAAAASAAAAGAAAAARRRLLGVSEEREEDEGRGGAKDLEEDGDEEALGGSGLGGSDSDDDGAAAEAAAAAARAIDTAATAATQQQLQQQQTVRSAEAALLHSLALRDPDAPPRARENPFAAGAAAGWGGTAPADGSAAAAALARAAAAAAASAASGANPMAYARAAKRVDVRALKVALWAEARAAAAEQQRQGGAAGGGAGEPAPAPLLFSELVSRVADGPRGRAAAPPGQLSPHLVFICLLHLCNEHSLELGRVEVAGGDGGELALTRKKLRPAVSLGGGADLTVAGVEVE